MAKIRIRRRFKQHIHVHNDLARGAAHFKEVALQRTANNDERGISFDILAELMFLAFCTEARLNLFGAKLLADWNERAAFQDKLNRIMAHFQLRPDFSKRPYSVISTLKGLRDSLAHGKPQFRELDEEVVIEESEISDPPKKHGWSDLCTNTFATEAFNDVEEIWQEMFNASGLTEYETLTRWVGGPTFLERL